MAYKVRITDSAKAELDEIVAYFVNTLCNPKAAVSLLMQNVIMKNLYRIQPNKGSKRMSRSSRATV